jgi:hypothetical protein
VATLRLGAVISCGLETRHLRCWRCRHSRYAGRHLRPGLRSASCPYALAHRTPPTATCVPFSRRCMLQCAGHHPRASIAAKGAQLLSPMALLCTHRRASSLVGRAPPLVASVHHSSTALVPCSRCGLWELCTAGSASGASSAECRYTCMVVTGRMPAHTPRSAPVPVLPVPLSPLYLCLCLPLPSTAYAYRTHYSRRVASRESREAAAAVRAGVH